MRAARIGDQNTNRSATINRETLEVKCMQLIGQVSWEAEGLIAADDRVGSSAAIKRLPFHSAGHHLD